MTVSPLIVLDNIPPGSITSDELVVPADATVFDLSLTREAWPDTGEEVIHCGLEVSFDDGQSWQYLAAFGVSGDDNSLPESSFSSAISDYPSPPLSPEHDPPPPPQQPPLRKVRATLKNFVTLSTTVTFSME